MILLPVNEPSQVGAARRRAVQEAQGLGLDDERCDRIAIIVTELATNLLRHASEGEILLSPAAGPIAGLHILGTDCGPGLPSIEAALTDGFSTATDSPGGIGGGLGAIRRLSDDLDIHSDPAGTTLVATVGGGPPAPDGDCAGLIVPKPGHASGGDIWSFRVEPTRTIVMLLDILGHGSKAAEIAEQGRDAFDNTADLPLEELEAAVADALVGDRGAASMIVEVPHGDGTLRAVGLGNVRGEIVHGTRRQGLLSAPGILGSGARRSKAIEHEWHAGSLLVLATDGLKTHGQGGEPQSLYARRPLTIATTLYRRYRRGTDDCGVVVLKSAA
ncbi:ATP-binding protein [Mangrovibrevibacter kandeliae]|uniref:ATP-binding protein n=1 Tax=Mangrovibrevibacter kandeliae TaxID=2968473 RepID=UPI002118D0E3|nr:ATP-binding protein [Aurantimonas sp. CSK15Z-1]MCQ8781498.1 ATP-binding protein [Aurantimonas sp. CSK15Z-1]